MSDSLLSERAPSAFRHRQFSAFFVAASLSNGASWMESVAVPVLLFDMTDSSTWLGLSVIATMLPAVLLSAPAGVLGDRVDRRLVLIATQTLLLCGSTMLFTLHVTGNLTPGRILILNVVIGIGTGLQAPVWQAFVPSLVPPESLVDAIRLNSIQFTIARIVGPAAAGLVVRQLGFSWAFGINAVSFLIPIFVLASIHPRKNAVMTTGERTWEAIRSALRWLRRDTGMVLMMFMAFFASAIGQSLQPVSAAISTRVFGHPGEDNAILLTSLGLGGLIAGLFTRSVSRRAHDLTGLINLTLVLYLASPLIVAATGNFAIGTFGFFVGGLAHVLNSVTVNSYLQSYAPDHLRGRIMGFYLLAVLAGLQVGGFLLGWFGDLIGMRWALLIDAGIILASMFHLSVGGSLRRHLAAATHREIEPVAT